MKMKLKYQLVLYYTIIIVIVISGFLIYITQQSKEFSLGSLRDELIALNRDIYKDYKDGTPFMEMTIPSNLRFTVIDTSFKVIYFSDIGDTLVTRTGNSGDEVFEAATSGEGSALRFSANSNKEFLYYAKKYPEFYIRTSIPYKY